jgi:hypothetical protein
MSQLEERSSSRAALDRSEDSFRLVSTLQVRRAVQASCAGLIIINRGCRARPGPLQQAQDCCSSAALALRTNKQVKPACSHCRCYLQPLAACCPQSFAATPLTSSAVLRAPLKLSGIFQSTPTLTCALSTHDLHVSCCHFTHADAAQTPSIPRVTPDIMHAGRMGV